MKFQVGRRFAFSHLYEVKAGEEKKIIETLRNNGFNQCFKSFGIYDIIAFEEADDLVPRHLGTSCEGVAGTTALSLYKIETDTYSSPSITEWVSDAPVIGYVALELDKLNYCDRGTNQFAYSHCSKIVDYLVQECKEEALLTAFYGSLGRAELVAIVKGNNLDEVWRFSTLARRTTESLLHTSEDGANDDDGFTSINSQNDSSFAVFSRTTTIPAISYNNIFFENDSVRVDGVEGNCEASISVDCPPGFEGKVSAYFQPEHGFETYGLLGTDDVLVKTKAPILTAEFIEHLFRFRLCWPSRIEAPISSVTSILNSDNRANTVTMKGYDVQFDLASLPPLDFLSTREPRLTNRILAFIHKYNATLNNRSQHLVIRDLRRYISFLSGLIEKYKQQYDSANSSIYIDESAIMEALESVELGLAQRLHHGFDTPESSYSVLLPPGEGFFSALIGVDFLVEDIVRVWQDNQDPHINQNEWSGFTIFSENNGFSLSYGDVIYLPYDAVHEGSSPKGSWLTLTHEICHAIYLRLSVAKVMSNDIDELHKNSYPLRAAARAAGIPTPVDDQLNEFFTHWYDYYHFFDKNFEYFALSVWRSWLALPIVQSHFSEYFLRSYVIYLLSNPDPLKDAWKDSDEKNNYLHTQWERHIGLLQNRINGFTPRHWIEVVDVKGKLIDLAKRYVPTTLKFYQFSNDKFRVAINRPYEKLDEHASLISTGTVILDEIENPYLLTKEVIFRNMTPNEPHVMTALTLSIKSQVTNLYKITSHEGDSNA